MATFSDILAKALTSSESPSGLHDHLWGTRRAFTPRFVDTLDAELPGWRDAAGPRWRLLLAARAGDVEPWIDLARLDLPADWTTPQRQRLVRWMRCASPVERPIAERDVLQRVARGLHTQWSARAPGQARVRWIVALTLRWGDTQDVRVIFAHAWRDLPTLDEVLKSTRPDVWRFAQRVEHHHRDSAWREAARLAQRARARLSGHSYASWGDHVAAVTSWFEDEPEAWRKTQARRLERAMNARLVWSWSALREASCSGHPLREMFASLVWEADTSCRLDARGQPRDLDGRPLSPRSLRLAHPSTLPELESWRARQRTAQPFEQLERSVFDPDHLELHEHGWSTPRLPGHVHTDTLMGLLRRRGWSLCVGLDNGVIPCFFRHDASSDTTALCQLERPLFSRSNPSPRVLSIRIVFLRGEWSRYQLTSTYYMSDHATGPSWRSGPRLKHVLWPVDVDPVTLSETLRDLHDAST